MVVVEHPACGQDERILLIREFSRVVGADRGEFPQAAGEFFPVEDRGTRMARLRAGPL